MEEMSKAELVRDSLLDLNPASTNRDIAAHCLAKHGVKLNSQDIYAAVGKESDRQLIKWDGLQLADVKKTVAKRFDGDFRAMISCARDAQSYVR